MQVVMRQIRSRHIRPDWEGIKKEWERTMDRECKPDLIKKFEAVVSDWEHQPTFKARKQIKGGAWVKIYIYPAGAHKDLWVFVSRGTKGPYQIPRNPPARSRDGLLHYQVLYDAHTRPPGLYGLGDGKKHGDWRSVAVVMHPGIKAREFEERIAKEYQLVFVRKLEAAAKRAIRAAERRG